MIESPLPSLSHWADALASVDVPVLPGTLNQLLELADIEEANASVDAKMLTQAISADPLMMLNVYAHVAQRCADSGIEAPETLTGSILMMGVGPFFHVFTRVRNAQSVLHKHPGAYEGLTAVIARARRAAHFSLEFAIRRQDEDAAVLHQAALLHDFAEMLLWCHAPELAQTVSQRLANDHTLRSLSTQQEVLGVSLSAVGQKLMRRWRLPRILIDCTNDNLAQDPKVRTVMLGVRIARHTQFGWDTAHAQAGLQDDVSDVAQLLNLAPDAALRMLMAIDS